jgi:hypothetical protein
MQDAHFCNEQHGFGVSFELAAARRRRNQTSAAASAVNLPLITRVVGSRVRTAVGLPHRDAGFVAKNRLSERLRLLMPNYGHGGAGMSSLGHRHLMAAELATEHQARQAAVIGCGSVGLTCATTPARVRRHDLRASPSQRTASNMSLAGFTRVGTGRNDRTPEWDAHYRRAADICTSYGCWLAHLRRVMAGQLCVRLTICRRRPVPPARPNLNDSLRRRKIMRPKGTSVPDEADPFTADSYPAVDLPRTLRTRNHALRRTHRDSPSSTRRASWHAARAVVINCTGLGARDLFSDQSCSRAAGGDGLPAGGELSHERRFRNDQPPPGGLGIHMMRAAARHHPRHVTTRRLDPQADEVERKRVVDNHIAVFGAMKAEGLAARSSCAKSDSDRSTFR